VTKSLVRVVCFLIAFGGLAIAACAQTPIDPSSVPDALVHMSTPDGCNPPYEICFEYTGPTLPSWAVLPVFFSADPEPTVFDPTTTSYQCDTIGPLYCYMMVTDPPETADFWGMFLFIPGAFDGETFGMTVTGGPVSFGSSGGLPCIAGCVTGEPFTVDPTPEPSTALLYMSGLLLFLLGGFAKKRLGAHSVAQADASASPHGLFST
jgi:hypothetical protein